MIDKEQFEKYDSLFKEALADNLNTSNAITVLYDVLKSDMNNSTKLALIEAFDKVLSLNLLAEEDVQIDSELEKYIMDMIALRNEAKASKNFEEADRIRAELLEKKIVLKDSREGTTYEVIK